ncbi:hypothetical protein WUBG_18094, partial [Wuchereria bancrofti]
MEYYACGADLTNQMKSRSYKLDALLNESGRIIAVSSHKCEKMDARTVECHSKEGVNFSENGSCNQLPLFFYNTYSSLFHNVPCLSVLSALGEEQLLSDCCAFLISRNQKLDVSQDKSEQCAKYRLARNLYNRISGSASSTSYPFDATSITGLSCDKNNSL